jgi:hypothetical protein
VTGSTTLLLIEVIQLWWEMQTAQTKPFSSIWPTASIDTSLCSAWRIAGTMSEAGRPIALNRPPAAQVLLKLIAAEKRALVYFAPTKDFHVVGNQADLLALLARCRKSDLDLAVRGLGLKSPLTQTLLPLAPTKSEAISGLETNGYVLRRNHDRNPDNDGRGMSILRTHAGTEAMSAGSVLESGLLRQLLELLTEDERRRAVEGLELIAHATEKRTDSL